MYDQNVSIFPEKGLDIATKEKSLTGSSRNNYIILAKQFQQTARNQTPIESVRTSKTKEIFARASLNRTTMDFLPKLNQDMIEKSEAIPK